ncbi:MAG: Gfo/Idh/MocA family oxidoreductase [Candidatus Latescibacteria bacterium]|jgi:glucose-fructose oxidoreductase|nr:Gfo/Idh/MocA family oxidoreductase [Candidatus Latescibacterota bacterium]
MAKWKVAGINFDHLHMGDNLRMAFEHEDVEIVGVCDERPERMQQAVENFTIPQDRVFRDYRACLEQTRPDIVLLCPATAEHGEWTEKVAPFGVHIIMEKPFAATLEEADRMIAAIADTGKLLAINWPLAWYPPHRTAYRLVAEGVIGEVIEVHYYDGNRGPLWHVADKVERTAADVEGEKPESWFYKRASGGGSLLDYLGYGTTLGTWYMGGRAPVEVTATVDSPQGLEVDEHSVTVARYEQGLSKFETRWGTFTDPWSLQPQPKCGFVIVGREGTISSYDYEETIRVQTRESPAGEVLPVDALEKPFQNPVQYAIHCIEEGKEIEGPLAPALCRVGQQIVDTAFQSAAQKRTLPLIQ